MPILHLIGYLMLVGGAWLFRASYVGWLGPYVFAAAVLLPLIVLLISLPSMLGLSITLLTPKRVIRGSPAKLTVDFVNRRLLPVHSITLHLEVYNRYTGDRSRLNYIFRNLESSRSELPLDTALCGELECRVLRFECRDALGIFSIRRKGSSVASCTVMPQAVEGDEPVNFEAALKAGTILKPKYGGGFAEDHDLRPYRPGDTASSIHWKLSSKMDEPIVREPLIPENSTIFLVLSRVGEGDRGLEVLRWLSRKLTELDEPHVIVADSLYVVGNEGETDDAVASILSWPLREPCGFDASGARCIFTISAGEVRWQ